MSLMANVYYDFNRDGMFSPYLGAGIGFSSVDVTFNPSGVGIIDDDDTAFAYQVKVGATLNFSDRWEAFAEYGWREADIEADAKKRFVGNRNVILAVDFFKELHVVVRHQCSFRDPSLDWFKGLLDSGHAQLVNTTATDPGSSIF
jgi:hypothetical protein